jgi:hypothetical protein
MAEKRARDEDEESLPPSKLPRAVLVDDASGEKPTPQSAAKLLLASFEEAADRLRDALDAGKINPTLVKFRGQRPIATYNISWSSDALLPMRDAVHVMGDGAANNWFCEIFQDAAGREVEEEHGPIGTFSFRLNYGETWEESTARQARLNSK